MKCCHQKRDELIQHIYKCWLMTKANYCMPCLDGAASHNDSKMEKAYKYVPTAAATLIPTHLDETGRRKNDK